MTMEGGKLEYVLDSVQLFRCQVDDIRQQHYRRFLDFTGRMVALVDLPVSTSSVKRRKGSTHYFQTNEVEQCGDVYRKENILAGGGTVVRSAQLKSCKTSSRKTRRRKPLADSQAVNQARQLDRSTCTGKADEAEREDGLKFGQRGNEELFHPVEGNKCMTTSKRENEELVHSMEGNNRILLSSGGNDKLVRRKKENKSTPTSVPGNEELVHSVEVSRCKSMSISPIRTTLAGEAKRSVRNLGKPSDVPLSNTLSIGGGEPAQVKTEVPDLDAPVLTRARARILQNAGCNVTVARGEPPSKQRRSRRANPSSSSPAKDESAGKVPTIVAQTPLQQQKQERLPSKGKRKAGGNSPCSPETGGNVGEQEALGEEQDMNARSICTSQALKEETAGKTKSIIVQIPLEHQKRERQTARMSAVVKRNTRSSSRSCPLTDGTAGEKAAFGEELDVNIISNCISPAEKDETAGKIPTIVAQTPSLKQKREERPPSTRSLKRNARGNSHSPPQADGNVGEKEAFGEEDYVNARSICSSPARKDDFDGNTQSIIAQIPLEQQEGDRPTSGRSVVVKRNTRSGSRSCAPTDGTAGEKNAFGEEPDVNPISICISPAEKDETAGKLKNIVVQTPSLKQEKEERPPSTRSLKRNARGNSHSPPQADGNVDEKEPFGEEDFMNARSICTSPARKDDFDGKTQSIIAQIPLEQQEGDRPTSGRSVVVKRNTRSSSRSCAPTDGTAGEKNAFGEEPDVNPISICISPAEKDETAGKIKTIVVQTPSLKQEKEERPPSTRSLKRNTRGNSHSPPQTEGNVGENDAFGEDQSINLNSICSSQAQDEGIPGKLQVIVAQTPLKQQLKTNKPPTIMSVRRNATGNSHSPPQTHGDVRDKDAFRKEQEMKSSSICSLPAGKEETSRKTQPIIARTPLEQQKRERPLSRRSVAVKRSTRGNSHSPPQADGHVAKKDEFGEEQELKVANSEEAPPNASFTSEEDDIVCKKRPSKKARAPSGRSTRLNSSSQVETDSLDPGGSLEDAKVNEHCLGSLQASVEEDLNSMGGSVTKMLRERNDKSRAIFGDLVETDRDVRISEKLVYQNEMHCTAGDQCLSKIMSSKESVFAASSLLTHTGGDELTQADVMMPSAQNGSASKLTLCRSSAKTTHVDVADPGSVEAMRGNLGDLPSEDLASPGVPLRRLSTLKPLLKDSADYGSKLISEISFTLLQENCVEREANIVVLDHRELKNEDTSSIPDAHAEEKVEQERSAVMEAGHLGEFSNSLREKEENSGRTPRVVTHSLGAHSLAVELEIKETTMDAIGAGSANLQSTLVTQASQSRENRKDGMQLLSVGDSLKVSVSPPGRDRAIADEVEFHDSPEVVMELLKSVDVREGKSLPGQVTDRTPARKAKLLRSIIRDRTVKLFHSNTTPEVPGTELIDEKTGAVVPGSLRLNLLKSKARGYTQGGLIPGNMSDVAGQAHECAGELKRIILSDLGVNPSLEQEFRKQTAGNWDEWQTKDGRVSSPVEKWDSNRQLEGGEKKSLVAVLSNLERPTRASVSDHHRVDGVEGQRFKNLSYNLREGFEVSDGKMVVDHLARRGDCAQTQIRDGKAVSSLTIPVSNWRSESFCSMMGASAQCRPTVIEPALLLRGGIEVQEVPEFSSPVDRKSDQKEITVNPSSLLIQNEDQDQDPDKQDAVSTLRISGMVDCSQETDDDCQVSLERDCTVSEQLLSHEELNMSKPISLSRGEVDSAVSSLPSRTEDDAVPLPDPCCHPVRSVDALQQIVSSKIGNAPKPSSNLITSMKSFVPVVQQAPPSFMPDGKRFVKVKALVAAEAARKAEENRNAKDRLRKKKRGTEAGESGAQLKEAGEACKLDGESSCGSILSPKKKVLVQDRPNSRNLFSPESKSKQATILEIEKKVKKNQAELKRMEEERKRKLLAMRETKEQAVKQNRQKQELLKQRRDQKRLGPELEDKVQSQQASEELKVKNAGQGTLQAQKKRREAVGEKENDPVEGVPLVVRLTVEGQCQNVRAGQARPGQTPGKTRENFLGPSSLPLRSAVRVPIIAKDKWTPGTVATASQHKGRHPSSSSSSSRLLSSNTEPARLPSLNVEAARLSSLNAEAAQGLPENSTHTFSLDNRPTEVRQGGSGESVSCVAATPCTRARAGEDMGPTSYEISPYRDSSDDEEDDPRHHVQKHIPLWARKENLIPHVRKQVAMDPDVIFHGKTFAKTCSLKEIFGRTGSKKIQDFGKRSGSGDWLKDRMSWKEELQYKIHMGYETSSMQQFLSSQS